MCVFQGNIGTVSIRIPYTHLWSQAWQLYIEDIELLAYVSANDLWNYVKPGETIDLASNGLDDSGELKYNIDHMEEKWWKVRLLCKIV